MAETVCVPASIARKLEKEHRIAERMAAYWRSMSEEWTADAIEAMQPEAFYEEYSEKTMRAMQALLTRCQKRSLELEHACSKLIEQLDESKNTDEPISAALRRANLAIYGSSLIF